MQINGVEISFNIDNKDDLLRYEKAINIFYKKNSRVKKDDVNLKNRIEDIEIFLTSCIKKDEVEELLKENKVSVLFLVLSEFIEKVSDEMDEMNKVIDDANSKIIALNDKFESDEENV